MLLNGVHRLPIGSSVTVSTDYTPHSYYPGSAMAAESLASLPFFSSDELIVTHESAATGVLTVLTEDVGYAIGGLAAGGALSTAATITALAEYAAGDIFHVQRRSALLQEAAWGAFEHPPALDIQRTLDRAVLGAQEARALAERGFTLPLNPLAAAGLFAAVDADGLPVFASGTGSDAAFRTDAAGSLGALLFGWIGRLIGMVGQSVARKLYRTVDLLDFVESSLHDGMLDGSDTTTDITPYLVLADTAGVRRLKFPARVNIKTKFTPTHDCLWEGDDQQFTKIHTSVAGYAVERLTSGARIALRDLTVIGDGVRDHHGFWLFDPATRDIDNCEFREFFGFAVRQVRGVRNAITRSTFVNCGKPVSAVVTATVATPGKINFAAHGVANDTRVVLTSTGNHPTPLRRRTVYFARNVGANDMELALTPGGASIAFSDAGTGVLTAHAIPYYAIFIDPENAPYASVEALVSQCYIGGGTGGGILVGNATAAVRRFTYADTVIETTKIAISGLNSEMHLRGWVEANEVDLDTLDCLLIDDQLVSTNGTIGWKPRWSGVGGGDRHYQWRESRHGWLYGTNAFACSTAWQTLTFNEFTNPYAKTLPNVTGIVDLPLPGDYRATLDAMVGCTTAAPTYAGQVVSNPPTQAEMQALDNAVKALSETKVREVRVRLMLSIDGAAYAEVPGSDTAFSVRAGEGARVTALVPFTVPLGSIGAFRWEASASNADVVFTTTLNPDASGSPAAPAQAVNRRMLVEYLGTVR